MFGDFNTLKGKHERQSAMNRLKSVSVDIVDQGISQSSKRTSMQESGADRRQKRTPKSTKKTAQEKGKKATASPSNPRALAGSSEESEIADANFADQMVDIPHSRATEKKQDYKAIKETYQRYWTTCEDAYVLKVDEKKEIDICQLVEAPVTFNIRSKQEAIIIDIVNWLLNIPDKSTKQTLCVMPVGHTKKPEKWEDIEGGQFYIINGQHSVAASKFMFDDKNGVDHDQREHFWKWNCFIVWSEDAEKLRCISAYYNCTNHFIAVQPSWSTNILGARAVWEAMDKPINPKQVQSVGTVSSTRRTTQNRQNKNNFQKFEKAVLVRFSMIVVNKNLKFTKKSGKGKEEKLKVANELKLITTPDHVYKLWSEMITAAAHGELLNPDTDKLFNEKEGWNPENLAMTQDFFKHLGNLSYDELAKLAKHILNQTGGKRTYSYPKCIIKAISSVLDSCYIVKEWVERRKRKHLVKKELHLIDPRLGLLNARNELISEN